MEKQAFAAQQHLKGAGTVVLILTQGEQAATVTQQCKPGQRSCCYPAHLCPRRAGFGCLSDDMAEE